MKIFSNAVLMGMLLVSMCVLSGCANTVNGMSRDVNHDSDAVERSLNS